MSNQTDKQLKTYNITVKGRGTIEGKGSNPVNAFNARFKDIELISTDDENNAKVCIELVGGKRKTKNFYTFKEKKRYKQGDECTFEKNTEEYRNLQEFATLLTKNSPSKNVYAVQDIYLDYGSKWMWTTISNVTRGYQALNPREWFDIVNRDRDYKDILNDMLNDKFNPDNRLSK